MLPVIERYRDWLAGLLWGPSERRRAQRDPLHASVSVVASGVTLHASARDWNAGGLGAIVCGDLKIGERVLVKMGDHRLPGSVRHRNGYRYGFEFVKEVRGAEVREAVTQLSQPNP
jgi:hypothetical protein